MPANKLRYKDMVENAGYAAVTRLDVDVCDSSGNTGFLPQSETNVGWPGGPKFPQRC